MFLKRNVHFFDEPSSKDIYILRLIFIILKLIIMVVVVVVIKKEESYPEGSELE